MFRKYALWAKDNWDLVQLLFIVLLAPFFLFPRIEQTWILLLVPLTWLASCRFRGAILTPTILDGSLLLLCVQVLISCLLVPELGISLPKISGFVYGLVVFYALCAVCKDLRFIRLGIRFFMLGGVMFALCGILGMSRLALHAKKNLDVLMNIRDRIPSLNFKFPGAELGFHPNAVGGSLVLLAPLLLVIMLWYAKDKKRPWLLLAIGLLLETAVLLLTLSRGSWLALFLATLFVAVHFINNKRSFILLTLIFVLIAAAVYIALIGPGNIAASSYEIEGKIMSRGQLWAWGTHNIGQHPVFGIGMNQVRLDPRVQYHTSHLHNHYIHTAAELGLPGLVAYLAVLLGVGFMVLQVWRKPGSEHLRMAILGLGSGQLAHAIFGIADSIPLGAKAGIIFWISLALITSIYNYAMSLR